MELTDWSAWAAYYLMTQDIEGLSGVFKGSLGDFIVEEVPAYLPQGVGEHLYLWLEKRDVSARWLEQQIERQLGVNRRDIGAAGLKDRGAITRQWISVPIHAVKLREVYPLEGLKGPLTDQITILEVARHRNKLKRGHLNGNLFEIALRQLPEQLSDAQIAQRLEAKLERLSARGLPNYFGPQRFGHHSHTLKLGLGLLQSPDAPPAPLIQDRLLKRLAANAVQSAHFNAVLAHRLAQDQVHEPQVGDVLKKRDSGGLFVVLEDELEAARQRAKDGEVVITGPLYGPRMLSAQGEVAALEQQLLAQLGLQGHEFNAHDKLTPGERRPLLIWPESLSWRLEGQGADRALWLKFFLPAGSYATILIREILSEVFDSQADAASARALAHG